MVITSAVITAAIKRRLNQLFVEPRINDPLRKLTLLTHLFIAGLDLDWIGLALYEDKLFLQLSQKLNKILAPLAGGEGQNMGLDGLDRHKD